MASFSDLEARFNAFYEHSGRFLFDVYKEPETWKEEQENRGA